MQEIRAIVRGRVQGVGFRVTARVLARQLGIKGTVKNLTNGTVEIYAQAEDKLIEQFFVILKKKIGESEMSSIEIQNLSNLNQYNDFNIIY